MFISLQWLNFIRGFITVNYSGVQVYNGELGGGKPTHKIHSGNMDRRSELPDTRKGRSGSNRDKWRITFLRYEDELVPGGRPAILSLQK